MSSYPVLKSSIGPGTRPDDPSTQGVAAVPHDRRSKIKELEVMVAEVIRETSDVATLVLFTGNDRLEYEPGHFLSIRP